MPQKPLKLHGPEGREPSYLTALFGTRRRRRQVGFACAWPMLCVAAVVLVRAVAMTGPEPLVEAWALRVLIASALLAGGVALVACLLHVAHNKAIEDGERVPWTILLLLIGILAAPAYWWLHVRDRPSA